MLEVDTQAATHNRKHAKGAKSQGCTIFVRCKAGLKVRIDCVAEQVAKSCKIAVC